jgi:hypothetical protein
MTMIITIDIPFHKACPSHGVCCQEVSMLMLSFRNHDCVRSTAECGIEKIGCKAGRSAPSSKVLSEGLICRSARMAFHDHALSN